MQTLQNWQRADHQLTAVLVIRVAVCSLFIGLLIGFMTLLRAPYERPGLKIAIIAPGVIEQAGHTSKPINTTFLGGPEAGSWRILDRDVASLLCYASGQHVIRTTAEKFPSSCLLKSIDLPLNQQANWLAEEMGVSLRPQSTLVVYITGVLSIENKQPALCGHSPSATHGGGELLLLPLLEGLKNATCKQALLCIDLVPPSHASPAIMTTPLMIDELTERLEQLLASQEGQTPLAVCIGLSTADHVVATGGQATALATALASALQVEADGGSFNLHRLKNRVANLTQNQSTTLDPIWLTSLHWPVTSDMIHLPPTFGGSVEASVELATSRAKEAAEVIDLYSVSIDELTESQLWQVGKQAIDRLDLVQGTSLDQQPSGWLPLPTRLSYRQRHPFSSAWLEHLWHDLAISQQLSAGKPDIVTLRSFVKYLLALSQRQTSSANSSPQATLALRPWQDVHVRATNSLLINAWLGRLGAVDQTAGDQAEQWLSRLTQTIDHASEVQECKSAIDKLCQQDTKLYVETEQCRALCDSGLSWSTLQRVLRLQLVSGRAHLDLFQSHPEVQDLLQEADACARQVREEIDLRPDSHTDAELDLLVDRALGLYQAALDHMTEIGQRIEQHNRRLSSCLQTHAWTKVNSLSTKGVLQSLDAFVAQWKSLQAHSDADIVPARCQQVHELLRDRRAERGQQIDAILELNRFIMATAESRFTTLAMMPARSRPADSSFESGALRLLLSLVASQRAKSASTSTASASTSSISSVTVTAAWPASSWVAEKLQQLVETNLENISQQMQGATAGEVVDLNRRLATWKRMADELGDQGIEVAKRSTQCLPLLVDAPSRIDVQGRASVALPCSISYEKSAELRPQIAADYDQQSLAVHLDDELLHSGKAIDLPNNTLNDAGEYNPVISKSKVVLTVKRMPGRVATEPIVLLVSQGNAQRRAVVHLTAPHPPMVDVQLAVDDQASAAGQGTKSSETCVLWANRQQSIALQLTNQRLSMMQLSVQVWGTQTQLDEPPAGTVAQSMGQQWLNTHPELVLLAQAPQAIVDARSSQRVNLIPATDGHDWKQSPWPCRGLLIGVTDQSSKSMQFQFCKLHVRHPSDYVEQQVTLDHEHQSVLINTRLKGSTTSSAVHVQHRLIDWPAASVLAQAEGLLSHEAPAIRTALSFSRSRADRLVLVTHVDGWPGVWVKVFNRDSAQFSTEPIAYVRPRSNLVDGVLPTQGTEVCVDVEAWSSIPVTERELSVQVGWDRNHDRTFVGEATLAATGLSTIKARYHGVAATGAMLIEGRIEPPRFVLPTTGLSNERTSVLVQVQYDQQTLARADMTVVVDRQAPQVVRGLFDNADRCLHGAPATIHIETDDRGLSGVARVEAAWAVDGRIILSDDMKPVPAMLRPDGRWTLTLPTVALPAGENLLLVRAIDSAGNCSETYASSLRLRTQAELDEQAAAVTSSVFGTLMFARVPQSGLRVELLQTPIDEKSVDGQSKQPTVETEQRLVAETLSQADGSFRLERVRSGNYELRVSGIVRGMKMQRTRPIMVAAPKSGAPIMWRLDTQP